MGSSAKKKKERKKDFQKPKLKVGKVKPKAANQTDTTFRSKAIVLNQQSLQVAAPTISRQFLRHLSLLSSRSDTQRRDALAHMASILRAWSSESGPLPEPLSTILHKVYPLLLDGSHGVRQQTRRVLESLADKRISDHISEALPYIRAGMTHLAADIRLSSVEVLGWLLELAPQEVVSCAGGWLKTLNCFLASLNWHRQEQRANGRKWSSSRVRLESRNSGGDGGKILARNLLVLADFLRAGFCSHEADDASGQGESEWPSRSGFPFWDVEHHAPPSRSNPYGYLDLFASPQQHDQECTVLEDAEDRIRCFRDRGYATAVDEGLASARKDGGEVGRAAGLVAKVLQSACHWADSG